MNSAIKKMNFVVKFSLALALATVGGKSHAAIYLDRESEPLPLVDLKVVLPVGFDTTAKQGPGAGNLLGTILESGTEKMDRTAFLEKLADFGAVAEFGVSNEYSTWELTFPIVEGKNYDELIALLKQNWQTPRWTNDAFGIARIKLEAELKASADRDNSLAIGTLRRWLNKYELGGCPLFIEDLPNLTVDKVKDIYTKNFLNVKEIWAGAVAPDSSEPLIKKILTEVFSRQGDIKVGPYLKKLETAKAGEQKPKASQTILLVDKDSRAQTVTTVMAVGNDKLRDKDELSFNFGNHIYFDSGLASVFTEEIRAKRGLAYSVSSAGDSFHDFPMISLYMNPVRERADEAFQAASGLMNQSFVKGSTLETYAPEAWQQQWQSFRYGRVLTRGTPNGRLAERLAVVTGDITPGFYKSDVNKWKVNVKDVNKTFIDMWKNSAFAMAVVGSVKETKPIVEKYFPGATIRVINYRDTVSAKSFPDKL